jgi:hypothetical protein
LVLSVGCMPHQPFHAVDDVSTPECNWALVIPIASDINKRILFPHPESLIISYASHELLEAISVFEASETQSGDSFLQPFTIECLHALLLDPTLDIFILFTHRKWIVGIVVYVHLKATVWVELPWLSNVIPPRSTGAGVCSCPHHWRLWWLRLRVCNAIKVVDVGTCVQDFQ